MCVGVGGGGVDLSCEGNSKKHGSQGVECPTAPCCMGPRVSGAIMCLDTLSHFPSQWTMYGERKKRNSGLR